MSISFHFILVNTNRNIDLDLNINNIKVKQVSVLTILSIIIDCKLNWKSKLNYFSNIISRTIEILHKVKNKLNIIYLI